MKLTLAKTTAPPPPKAVLPVWLRGLRAGARLGLIGLLLWACWSAAGAWSHLLGWLPFSRPEAKLETPVEYSFARLAPFSGQGFWTFPGLAGKVQAGEATEPEIKQFLAQKPGAFSVPETVSGTEKTWLKLLQKIGMKKEKQGAITVYRLDHLAMKALVFTQTQDGVERLALARLAWPAAKKQWHFLEFVAGAQTPETGGTLAHLLPLPEGVESLCNRTDGTGDLYCQVVTTKKTLEELSAFWQTQGWTIHPDAQSQQGGAGLICTRGKETVIVWTTGTNAAGEVHPLLLLRGTSN